MSTIESKASLASTRLLQLKTTVRRKRECIVIISEPCTYELPYDCICVGEATTRAMVAKGTTPIAAYWPSVAKDVEDLKFLIASPSGEGVGLSLDDFGSLYPHLGEWDGTSADAISKLSRLLGYERCVPFAEATRPQFHLVVQLYVPPVRRRWRELCASLKRNAENPLVDRIHVICETAKASDAFASWPTHLKEKLIVSEDGARLSYRGFRDYVLSAAISADAFVCLANADIYFDETLRELWSADMTSKCLALLRYDVSLEAAEGKAEAEPKIFGPRDDSQDCWIFRVEDLKKRAEAGESWSPLTFTVGQAGCDNAFAGELVRRRWTVANPCMSIRTLHVHESAYRTYRQDDRVSLGVYATVAPCGLLERPLWDSDKFHVVAKDTVSVPRSVVVAAANTEASKRGLDTLYKTVMPQLVSSETKEEVATLKVLEAPAGACITEDGLVAFNGGIGFSAADDASELAWAQTKYNALTPIIRVERALFVPGCSQVAGDELLRIGRALWMLRQAGGTATMPSEYERLFAGLVRGTGLTLRKLGEAAAMSSEPAIGSLPSLNTEWHAVATMTLRSVILPRVPAAEKPSEFVLIGYGADEAIALEDMRDEKESVVCYENLNANPATVTSSVRGARVVVGCRGSLGYIWAMRHGSVYIDTEPCAQSAFMATMCGIKYVPITLADDMPATFARSVLEVAMQSLESPVRADDVGNVAVSEAL